MSKYDRIDIVDVDYSDEIIPLFIEDVEKSLDDGWVPTSIIGTRELIAEALDELVDIEYTPTINNVTFGDNEELHILSVDDDYMLHLCPLKDFLDETIMCKIYIDADTEIDQSIIDKYLDDGCDVVLFSVDGEEDGENEEEAECCCPKCKGKAQVEANKKYFVNGKSVSKEVFDKEKKKIDAEYDEILEGLKKRYDLFSVKKHREAIDRLDECLKEYCKTMDKFNNALVGLL